MKKTTFPLFYAGKKQQFARSVVVGDLVFLSAVSGRPVEPCEACSPDPAVQTRTALDKVRTALIEAGTSMDNIVKTTIYLKRIEDSGIVRQTEKEYWQKHGLRLLEEPPASTLVQPVSLGSPDTLVELEIIATLPR